MEDGLAEAIDEGKVGPRDDPKVRSKLMSEEFGWDKELTKKIWCFGPDTTGANAKWPCCWACPAVYLHHTRKFVCRGTDQQTLGVSLGAMMHSHSHADPDTFLLLSAPPPPAPHLPPRPQHFG